MCVSPEPILHIFEKAYNEAHDRSYEGSMSACISYITAQPSVVELKDMDELLTIVIRDYDGCVKAARIGSCIGALCDSELAKELWEKGKNPRLISCD